MTENKHKILLVGVFALTIIVAPVMPGSASANTPSKMYQGNVEQNELIDNLERLGIKCEIHEGTAHTLIVRDVRMGSNAFYKGVSAGDAIKGLANNNGLFQLTIDRGGKTYQLALKPLSGALTDSAPLTAQANQKLLNGSAVDKVASIDLQSLRARTATSEPHIGNVNETSPPIVDINPKGPPIVDINPKGPPIVDVDPKDKEKEKDKKLVSYDIELILDITGSMAQSDGTGNLSKFQWCHEQVRTIAQKLAPYGKTFTITTFNNSFDTMERCNPEKVEQLYGSIRPRGGTDLVDPLLTRCEASLARQRQSGKRQLIAIISDGEPNIPRDPKAVNRALIEFSKQLAAPGDVTITFLQIGDTFEGRDFCVDLDENLTNEGAKYDLVHTKTFDELKHEGIVDALIDAIHENETITTSKDRHMNRFLRSLPKTEAAAHANEDLQKKINERKEIERQLFGK